MEKKIVIIGCGWLGAPLAHSLKSQGHTVFGTTRTGSAPPGILPLHFDMQHPKKVPGTFLEAEVLVYSVPPLELPAIREFFEQIDVDKKIVFISATSVYGKSQGMVDEESALDLEKGNALLIAAEAYMSSRFSHLTIIRPGGLYGGGRHPIFFLQAKKALTSGEEFTHLVHGDDVIAAIEKVIEKNCWGEIFNLVSDLKMKKKDYYPAMALKLGLVPPEYLDNALDRPTQISNEKSQRILGLGYHDPLEYKKV